MTPRVIRACAAFGLLPRESEDGAARAALAGDAAARLDAEVSPGEVGVVTGPSGCGKSTILRALAERLRARGDQVVVVEPVQSGKGGRAVIDVVPGALEGALRALAAAGLGEAPLLARRASDLSDGQRSRLGLARAFALAKEGGTLLIDELGSGLDAMARTALAATLSRWVRTDGRGTRVIAATVHGGVVRGLVARIVADVDMGGRATLRQGDRGEGEGCRLAIEGGTIADYHALSRHHYRAGRPATVAAVLRARCAGATVGVLVVSMPTLEGWWRELAWPGRFRTGDKRRDARRLNEEVRCISRVVVDPRYRGLGVARRLVRAYLDRPRTALTESCAAMGAWCPFLVGAGMIEYHAPPARRDARLADALAACGLEARALLGGSWPPLLEREVRRWAADSRTTRELGDREVGEAAWRALCSPRVAYASEQSPERSKRRGAMRLGERND